MVGGIVWAMSADRLSQKHVGWYFGVPALVTAASIPFGILFPLWQGPEAVVFLPFWALLVAGAVGPMFAIAQLVSRPDMRAFSAVILLTAMTLIGLGLGLLGLPPASGALNCE